jgi:hypothetical protein
MEIQILYNIILKIKPSIYLILKHKYKVKKLYFQINN